MKEYEWVIQKRESWKEKGAYTYKTNYKDTKLQKKIPIDENKRC